MSAFARKCQKMFHTAVKCRKRLDNVRMFKNAALCQNMLKNV